MLQVSLSEQNPKDGISIWNTLIQGEALNKERSIVYSSYHGPAIVNNKGYKVRYNKFAKAYDMYHLPSDPQEKRNISSANQEEFEKLKQKLIETCKGNIESGICNY